MKKTHTLRRTSLIASSAAVGMVAATAFAMLTAGAQEPPSQEKRAAIAAAITAQDFQAFQSLTAESPRQLTEDQFNVLIEAHALREAGDKEAARALLEEAGIEKPLKRRHMERRMRMQADR